MLQNAECRRKSSGARGPPQFLKKRCENAGANENLSCGFPPIPGIAPRVAPRIVVLLGQHSCRTKVPRISRVFVPNFAPNLAPNFPRNFRGFFVLRFVGDGDQKKFTKNLRHVSMQKLPGKHEITKKNSQNSSGEQAE